MNGISSVTNCPRRGQAYRVVTPEAIAAVETIVKKNHSVAVNAIAIRLDIIRGSVHHIVHDFLEFHKYLIN
jgi:DNA polymerase II small subunit/DNA polymerase delta subunit B